MNVRKLPSGGSGLKTDGVPRGTQSLPEDSSHDGTPSPDAEKLTFTNESFVCDVEDAEQSVRPSDGVWDAPLDAGKEAAPAGEEEEAAGWSPVQRVKALFLKHKTVLRRLLKASLFVLYNAYLGFAVRATWNASASWCEGVRFLTVLTAIAYAFAFHAYVFVPHLLRRIRPRAAPLAGLLRRVAGHRHTSRVAWCAVLVAVVAFLVADTRDDRYRLVSAGGLLLFVFFGYLCSKHRSQVQWRHLLWGLTLQFCTGLLVLRWSVGRDAFACLGDKVEGLLDVTDRGSAFVFGYLVSGEMVGIAAQPAVFAFKVLSVVIFFSFLVSLLYHWGAMQVLVSKVGWALQVTVGTTACESMNAAGNIFLGMTEAPLLIRPFLPLMTRSELHAVMTGGFATIAGSVLAAYINFGINASHLLTASVMAAPAALAYSKLVYPETEQSRTRAGSIPMEATKGKETNALEAATNGASAAISLVSNIAANLIAFVAFVALVDAVLGWLGSLVLWNQLSFQWLLSKAFIPVSLLMGVEWEDREPVANLIGLKTVVNEFVAYKKLGEYREQRLISARSEAIATFALCGFSNISSIGIQMGALSAMAPDRKSDLSQIAVRAMLTGTVVCFMNACVAGALLHQS